MQYWNKRFCIEVKADYACFTRPEMRAERVSYDVMTPSAARGALTAIFWKPAVRWIVKQIDVLRPIQWTSVRRNEVGEIMSNQTGVFIEDARQQRAALLLRDAAYRIHAELEFVPVSKRARSCRPVPEALRHPEEHVDPTDENPGKYYAIFERRARRGQCFNQPYLGCREFSAAFRFVEHPEAEPPPIPETRDLGFMLYDLDYSNPDAPTPAFFRAQLTNGVVVVPDWSSPEVRR